MEVSFPSVLSAWILLAASFCETSRKSLSWSDPVIGGGLFDDERVATF